MFDNPKQMEQKEVLKVYSSDLKTGRKAGKVPQVVTRYMNPAMQPTALDSYPDEVVEYHSPKSHIIKHLHTHKFPLKLFYYRRILFESQGNGRIGSIGKRVVIR